MRFTLKETLVSVTGFCIAVAAMAVVPAHHFLLPVGLSIGIFVLLGERKVACLFGSWFLASWLLVSLAAHFGR